MKGGKKGKRMKGRKKLWKEEKEMEGSYILQYTVHKHVKKTNTMNIYRSTCKL